MFDFDTWQELFQTIDRHRMRVLLTCFGIFWGIFMLVLLLGMGRGLENGALQNFDIARNTVAVWTRDTAIPYAGFSAGREIRLDMEDAAAVKRLPQVEVFAPILPAYTPESVSGLTIERGNRSVSFNVLADTPELTRIKPFVIEKGRYINPLDIAERRKVTVLGMRVKEELFEPDERVLGQYIRIGGIPYQVVGVVSSRARGESAMQDLQTVHVPLSTAQQTFNMVDRIGYLAVIPKAGFSAFDTEEAIKQLLRERHKISPDDQQALGSFNVERVFKDMQSLFSGINGFSWLVAIGTILAGVVGVANIMLITVRERNREIGIRKALGAKPAALVGMIVREAVLISSVAGYFGLIFGVVIVEAVAWLLQSLDIHSAFFANPEIDFSTALVAIGVLLFSGLMAGVLPGIKAARLNPVIALKDE